MAEIDNLLNVTQTAFILKVHKLTVRRYIREGRLKAVRAGGNIRIRESDLQEFNKDFIPNKLTFRGMGSTTVKIFTEIDPFFQIQGKGASLNLG